MTIGRTMIEPIALCAYYAAIILLLFYYLKQYTTTMSNNTTPNLFPHSLLQCMKDGIFDFDLFYLYNKRKRHLRNEEDFDNIISQCLVEENDNNDNKKERTPRSCFRQNINLCRLPDGTLVPVGPTSSSWFCSYIQSPALDNPKFIHRFRRRFRCSYASFLKLLDLVKQEPLFLRWQCHDAANRESSPIKLLLLGALRYIGRGWTFDDLEENTSISQETHRQFFHVFITWGSSTLYDLYVSYPTEKEDVNYHAQEMEQAGFHGCIASTDATHVTMNRCPISRSNEHMGHKEGLPSRSYNISVNHRRRILHTTRGHPARWNNKTLATFDEFIMKIKNGIILSDYHYSLFEKDEEDNIVTKSYYGCWILCDNGYQNWPVLMAPMKDAVLYKDIRWSKWVESVRKDVECTFGIMKGRFRIQKIGIRLQSIDAVDKGCFLKMTV